MSFKDLPVSVPQFLPPPSPPPRLYSRHVLPCLAFSGVSGDLNSGCEACAAGSLRAGHAISQALPNSLSPGLHQSKPCSSFRGRVGHGFSSLNQIPCVCSHCRLPCPRVTLVQWHDSWKACLVWSLDFVSAMESRPGLLFNHRSGFDI